MEYNEDIEFKQETPSLQVIETQRSARDEFEIKSSVGSFGSTLGVFLTSFMIAMILLGAIFMIRAFWLVIHPRFEVTIPKLPSLTVMSLGQNGDAPKTNPGSSSSPLPNVMPQSQDYSQSQIEAYVKWLRSRENVLAGSLTPKELFDLGTQVCGGLGKGFSQVEIASGFKNTLMARFPGLSGVPELVDDVMQSAQKDLCPVSNSSQ